MLKLFQISKFGRTSTRYISEMRPTLATLFRTRATETDTHADTASGGHLRAAAATTRVARVSSFSKLHRVEVLPNIKIWRSAPNFDIWNNFNSSQSSVEVRRTSTDEL